MSNSTIFKKTRQEQVYERLYRKITSPDYVPEEGLASVRELAKRFGTSVYTVHHALKKLESEGHLVRRRTSATYESALTPRITVKDMVGLWIGGHGDHVWGDLNAMICARLSKNGLLPVSFQTEHAEQEEVTTVLERLSRVAARYFIIHGRKIPPAALSFLLAKHKIVIGVVEWGLSDDHPGFYRVLSDYKAGVRLVAEHLWALGHRRVLIVGIPHDFVPGTEILYVESPGHAFVEIFTSMGGQCQTIKTDSPDASNGGHLDPKDLSSRFRQPNPPTAVFGLRDVEAWVAQRDIRQHLGDLNGQIAIVGYNDTPWSSMTHPSITTVGLNLPAITEETIKVLNAVQEDQEPPTSLVHIPPQLIVRETSISI